MTTNETRANKLTGSRRTNRIEEAAKQLRLARIDADGFDAAALRALEADCYQLLTGDFQRASELSELPETTHQRLLTVGEDDSV